MTKVFCDMDGVLVNFEKGAVEAVNKALESPPAGLLELAGEVVEE